MSLAYVAALQRFPVDIEREANQTLETALFVAGVAVAPTLPTISIYRPDGTALVTDAPATVHVTTRVVSYDLLGTLLPVTETLGGRWRLEWLLDGRHARQEAYLCRRRLYPVITHGDLLRRHSDLGRLLPAGKTTWEDQLAEAWAVILADVRAAGRRPTLITDPWALRGVHLDLALSFVFRDLSTYTQGAGKYSDLADAYAASHEKKWGGLALSYDDSDSGIPGAAAQVAAESVIYLNQRPGRW